MLLTSSRSPTDDFRTTRPAQDVVLTSDSALGIGTDTKTTVMVQMVNKLNSNEWLWDRVKFFDRRFEMQARNLPAEPSR